jgi:hypothetical protein
LNRFFSYFGFLRIFSIHSIMRNFQKGCCYMAIQYHWLLNYGSFALPVTREKGTERKEWITCSCSIFCCISVNRFAVSNRNKSRKNMRYKYRRYTCKNMFSGGDKTMTFFLTSFGCLGRKHSWFHVFPKNYTTFQGHN